MASVILSAPTRQSDVQSVAPVQAWLWCVAMLVFAMVLVGGVTRLTGSGLSITEWRPVSGAIPPLSDVDWRRAFALYRESPQYAIQNSGITLEDFRFLFWWEWAHRQLGRFIGLVYAAGFVWTLARRGVSAPDAAILFGLGLLLGMQGGVGWIMVASGLEAGMVAVEPVKLALHLTLACLFLGGVVWMASRLGAPVRGRASRGARVLPLLILAQIALGGLVAGSKAGWVYNTWPQMDGGLAPPVETLFTMRPWAENLVSNVALVQFDHRIMAYVVLAACLWHAWRSRNLPSAAAGRAFAVAALALGQAVLGVLTLVTFAPLGLSLAHQALAAILLIASVRHAALPKV